MRIKRKTQLIIVGAAILLLIVMLIVIYRNGYTSGKNKSESQISKLQEEVDRLSNPVAAYEEAAKEIDISVVKTQLQDIGELATIEYLYTDAGKYESAKQLWGKDVIFTSKSFVAKWDGSIKAGIEADQISVEVDNTNKRIIVRMPKAKILSHEIDPDSFETLDEKNGLFNPIRVEDIREFDQENKVHMETRAIENGILDKASKNAKDIIYKLLNNDLVQELGYSVEIEEVL